MKVQTAFTVSFIIDGEMDEEEKTFVPQQASLNVSSLPEMNGIKDEEGDVTEPGSRLVINMAANGLSALFAFCEDRGYGKKDEILAGFIKTLTFRTENAISGEEFKNNQIDE